MPEHGETEEQHVAARRAGPEGAEAGDEQQRHPEPLGEVGAQRVAASERPSTAWTDEPTDAVGRLRAASG